MQCCGSEHILCGRWVGGCRWGPGAVGHTAWVMVMFCASQLGLRGSGLTTVAYEPLYHAQAQGL